MLVRESQSWEKKKEEKCHLITKNNSLSSCSLETSVTDQTRGCGRVIRWKKTSVYFNLQDLKTLKIKTYIT